MLKELGMYCDVIYLTMSLSVFVSALVVIRHSNNLWDIKGLRKIILIKGPMFIVMTQINEEIAESVMMKEILDS